MIMLAFFPCFIAICIINTRERGAIQLLSPQNLFAAMFLAPLFLIFYSSGSALTNPFHWVITLLHGSDIVWLLVFYMVTWGLYIFACAPYILQLGREQKFFVFALLVNFVLLSQFIYGEYSDLMCRGSASLSFCLFVLIALAWKNYQLQGRWFWKFMLIFVFLLGAGSAILQNETALQNYGELQAPMRADQSGYSSEYLGRNDSFFGQYFRKPYSHKILP
jgi:hypothetical protein